MAVNERITVLFDITPYTMCLQPVSRQIALCDLQPCM